ncbi:uncharacterized protein K441DRAFT_555970, partial [Cenococcum geophilum 1.58]
RVSWSLSGNVLAVSSGDNKVTLWKEDLKGVKRRITKSTKRLTWLSECEW